MPADDPRSSAPEGLHSSLGIIGNCDDQGPRFVALARLADKAHSASLLRAVALGDARRLRRAEVRSYCGYVARELVVELHGNPAERRSAFFGLVTCQSVWECPCCSPRISAKRRDELNALLAWARAENHAVVMLTLTARHAKGDQLGELLDALKRAKARLSQRREWRALGLVGSVTATEVTYGASGWHPHFHCILILDRPKRSAREAVAELLPAWLTCLAAFGLSGEKAALQAQDASKAGEYVAGFGAASEVALGVHKLGRKGGRSPWQLLRASRLGDHDAGRCWLEYASAFLGRRQLVWSRGLSGRAGIRVADDEAAAEEGVDSADDTLRVWLGKGDAWRNARRRRGSLAHAAAHGGDLDAAEFGPRDSELLHRLERSGSSE